MGSRQPLVFQGIDLMVDADERWSAIISVDGRVVEQLTAQRMVDILERIEAHLRTLTARATTTVASKEPTPAGTTLNFIFSDNRRLTCELRKP